MCVPFKEGWRKIRTAVLQAQKEPEVPEELQENVFPCDEFLQAMLVPKTSTSFALPTRGGAPFPGDTSTCASNAHQGGEVVVARSTGKENTSGLTIQLPLNHEPAGQIVRHAVPVSSRSPHQTVSREKEQRVTIARAVQEYLQAHRDVRHRPKTLEWHQMVLGDLQRYVQTEYHLYLVSQMTETIMKDWIASLAHRPTSSDKPRSASTIETYARSARAFCRWLVEQGLLTCSPMSERIFPRTCVPLPHALSPATFDQVMRAGFSQQANGVEAKRLAARDQALLWVFFETGITVSEVCALRVADLDLQTGLLRVRGKGGKERQMALGSLCVNSLRSHLRQMEPTLQRGLVSRKTGGEPLFASKGKQPLTKNGVTIVFARFRTRAGITGTTISPQMLRHSFALRYLQAGGNPQGLQALMGYEGMAPVRQYLRWYDQLICGLEREQAYR